MPMGHKAENGYSTVAEIDNGLGYREIAEQMSILQNIIKGLNDQKNAGMDLAWLISDMTKIQETFDSFQTVIDYFNDPSADELYLDKKEYDTLGALIKELRSKIIMP